MINDDLIIENTKLVYFVINKMGLGGAPNFEDIYEARIDRFSTSC